MQPLANLQLERFCEGDASFVARLGSVAFGEYSASPGRSALWMAEHHVAIVARVAERRLGFAVLQRRGTVEAPELIAIAVSESARGRGVGSRLLSAVEALAAARGATSIGARTADFNLAALDLFLRRGYQIRRRRPAYYLGRFDACELVKPLKPRRPVSHP